MDGDDIPGAFPLVVYGLSRRVEATASSVPADEDILESIDGLILFVALPLPSLCGTEDLDDVAPVEIESNATLGGVTRPDTSFGFEEAEKFVWSAHRWHGREGTSDASLEMG